MPASDSTQSDDKHKIIAKTNEMKDYFINLAAELDKTNDNIKITKVAGGVAGVVGGGLATAGLLFAPFTFGISALVAAVIGAGLVTAGTVTSLTGSYIGNTIDENTLKTASKAWDEYQSSLGTYMRDRLPEFKKRLDEVEKSSGKELMIHCLLTGHEIIKTADLFANGERIADGGASAAGAAERVVADLSEECPVLSILGMGISMYDIVQGASELHNKTKSPAGDYLRKFAKELDPVVQIIQETN